jgi:hypothetical protein
MPLADTAPVEHVVPAPEAPPAGALARAYRFTRARLCHVGVALALGAVGAALGVVLGR